MQMRFTAAAFLVALILSACLAPPVPAPPEDPPVACTLIGCESQLTFELDADLARDETYEVEVCIDAECASATIEVPDSGFAMTGPFSIDADRDTVTVRLLGDDYSGTRAVTLSLSGSDGLLVDVDAQTEFERAQPNGPGCEPICWQATVRV